MPYRIPEVCKRDVHSIAIVRRQSSGKPFELLMVKRYTQLLSQFNILCSGCNRADNTIDDKTWIKRIEDFISLLNTFVLPLMDDEKFSISVRKMLCCKTRCQNLPNWPPHLNKDFLNWLCHKTAYIGYDELGIKQKDTNSSGSPGSERMKNVVSILVIEACAMLPSKTRRTRVKRANYAFSVAYQIRQLRHDPQRPVCGEMENREHKYQRLLMLELYKSTQSWLLS